MKIHTNMPKALKPFFIEELEIARNYLSNKNFTASWHHLERAHILGQPYPYHHTLVHWKMFLFGIRIKDLKEIVGQIPRLLVSFRFAGLTDEERYTFMKRFDLYMQRGGG